MTRHLYTTDMMTYRQPCLNTKLEQALAQISDTFNARDLDAFVAGCSTDPESHKAWGNAMRRLIDPQREVLQKRCEAPYTLGVTVVDMDVTVRDDASSYIDYTVGAEWRFTSDNDAVFYEMTFVNAGAL